jgi:hypothetical protein
LFHDDRINTIDESTNQINTNANSAAAPSSVSIITAPIPSHSSYSSLSNLRKRFSTSSSSSSRKKKSERQSGAVEILKIKEDNDASNLTNSNIDESSSSLSQHNYVNQDAAIESDHQDDEQLQHEDFDEEFNIISNKNLTQHEIATLLINKIDRKVQSLDRLWQELNRQALNYNNTLMNFFQTLQQAHKSFELVNQKLNEKETLLATQFGNAIDSTNIQSDKLALELEKIKQFQLDLSLHQPLIDDMCTHYANINQELRQCESYNSKGLSQHMFNTKYDDLNLRWSNLQSQLQEKYLHMYSLVESSGANIFLKLADSVQTPWQRGVSTTNKVPYYIK